MSTSGKQPVVAVVGVFDGVHRGHVALLRQARAWADSLGAQPKDGNAENPGNTGSWERARVLAVTFDCHPLSIVAPARCPQWLTRPADRDALLRATDGVDAVVTLPFTPELCRMTAWQFLDMLRSRYGVTHLLMGYDHNFGSDLPGRGAPADLVAAHYDRAAADAGLAGLRRGKCLDVTLDDGRTVTVSSSVIRRLLAEGEVTGAATLLGRSYALTARVIHGKHVGHTLGFPTANLDVAAGTALPGPGVYAARVTGPGFADAPAVVNIGRCPTVVGAGGPLTVEVHIPGLDRDLYGQPLTVTFTRRLRDERRFPSLDDLRAQLARDVAAVRTDTP